MRGAVLPVIDGEHRLRRLKVSYIRLRRGMLAALAVAVVAAAAGGLAYAQTSDGNTIKACAQTTSGQLRLDTGDGCRASEQAVQWPAAGPQTQERFYRAANIPDSATWLPLAIGFYPSVTPTEVVATNVAAGDYEITAQLTVGNRTGSGIVACFLLDGSTIRGFGQTAVGVDPGYSRQQTMTLAGALSLDHDATIALSCFSSPNAPLAAGAPGVEVADVTTTSVGTATITQEMH
jgi:hypothetical protein